MISKQAQTLTRQVLRLSSLFHCVPWEYGNPKTKFLIRKKSLTKFYVNCAILSFHHILLVSKYPVTLRDDNPLGFLRVIIHLVCIAVAIETSFCGFIEFIWSKDAIMGLYNSSFLYHQSFSGKICITILKIAVTICLMLPVVDGLWLCPRQIVTLVIACMFYYRSIYSVTMSALFEIHY